MGIAFFFLCVTILLTLDLEFESNGVEICGGRLSVGTD
jgi:hypothetical protein